MAVTLAMVKVETCSAEIKPEIASLDRDQLAAYYQALADKLGAEAWRRIDSKAKLEAEREKLHREFMFMIGLDPLPERTGLNVKHVRTIERDDYTIEVLHYQSLPGFYVAANLYKPGRGNGPFPAVIWGPGHGSGEFGTKTSRQPHAAMWARAGYICIVVDPIQASEIYGIHHGLAGYDLDEWYSRGYTPMAIEVWNTMRTVDYLLTRPDVDGDKLTLTGVSGGGHLSWMAGAADPRLTVVQPAAGTAEIPAHIRLNLQGRHCDCAYFVNTYRHDWTTLAGLVSPRPLLLHCSTGDAYYPPEGYMPVLEKAREIYSWFGKKEAAALSEVPGPHTYNPVQRARGVEFSTRWLLGKTVDIPEERDVEMVEAELLGALGGINAAHPENINANVYELLLPAAKPSLPSSKQAWETRRAEVMGKLRQVVLRNMPTGLKPVREGSGERDAYLLKTEPGIKVGMYSHLPPAPDGIRAAVIYVASTGDLWSSTTWGFMKPFPLREKATSKHMIYPRGIGAGSWDRNTNIKYKRDAMTLGRTLDDMRLADILCAIEVVASDPANAGIEELTVVGRGASGILGAYAALLDERVTRVVLHSPTASHLDGPHFLNVLRYTDIPETLGMLAPRCELVFLTHDIDNFGLTGKLYEMMGAGGKFRRCVSVTQALNLP
ncbi:MAG: hypothetical protein FVQ81_03650 [Candidatus Glassbacteria bacterium]|nr:hypothetical protein [Candidatus Glassbacteria bacterium]